MLDQSLRGKTKPKTERTDKQSTKQKVPSVILSEAIQLGDVLLGISVHGSIWSVCVHSKSYLFFLCYFLNFFFLILSWDIADYRLPSGSDSKESACTLGDLGLIPGSGKSPGGGNGNPLQYSCLKHSMDRGAWLATVHGAAKSHAQLSD